MRSIVAALFLFTLTAAPLAAQEVCPCVPVTHLWIVKTCSDWNCVMTDLAVANGSPDTFAVPLSDGSWAVMRRAAAGSAVQNPAEPLELQQFDGMAGAYDHYMNIAADQHPIIVSAPDGQALVIALRTPVPHQRVTRQ